jgi:DNA helicase II / ATP-dependent DNA helicase PcrA
MDAIEEALLVHVDDTDIAWVCDLMGLPMDAFDTIGDDDSRRSAIMNFKTMDFEACPGSGKTTLLVAKLAILAKQWRTRRQGICVLSHTNAARSEIGARLGSSSAGSALLQYPHFVGTIHSFVNEFLATPWIRSKNISVNVIDTDLTLTKRWFKLPFKTRAYLEKQNLDKYALQYDRIGFNGGDKKKLGEHTPTYKMLVDVCRETSNEGYFCYDEMFVWAHELLDSRPEVIPFIRARFPYLFIDEAQDNSELQSRLLNRLFTEGENPSIRQRFGDSNQAIYQYAAQKNGAQTDVFPGSIKCDLPRSYRFGQLIADLAMPLGITSQELIGAGPSSVLATSTDRAPRLYLFNDKTVTHVLAHYGQTLLEVFSSEELLQGKYFAVSGVHNAVPDSVPPNIPRTMCHYAPKYSSTTANKDTVLDSFSQFISRARCSMVGNGDIYHLVNAIASATLHLASLIDDTFEASRRYSSHRCLEELLADHEELSSYRKLISHFIAKRGCITKVEWRDECCSLALSVARAITGVLQLSVAATNFIRWPESHSEEDGQDQSLFNSVENVFSYPRDDPKVHINLGSIHSVKGKSLTATLVLDSFFKKHHLIELKPWLLGERSGGKDKKKGHVWEGPELLSRLKLHYVAMTRPSHLLCLAMRDDSLTTEELVRLQERGWKIINCSSDCFQ